MNAKEDIETSRELKRNTEIDIYNREIRTEFSLSPPFANEARRSHSRIIRSRGHNFKRIRMTSNGDI